MARLLNPGIFQGCFGPISNGKGPLFSQKEDAISQSEAPKTFSNFPL